MAIKVSVGERKTQEVKQFPKLMKSKNSDTIILATCYNYVTNSIEGVCLFSDDDDDCKIGEYSQMWTFDVFEDYNKPITLQNE